MSLQIIEWPDLIKNSDRTFCSGGSAMTIGVFDGLHLGHTALIKNIVSRGPNPTVVTFRENPKKVIIPEKFRGDIFSLKQKLKYLELLKVARVILIDFSGEFSKLNGRDFLDILAEKGKMVFLAVGSNFHCGYRQDTGADAIAELNKRKGIPTEVIPSVLLPPEYGGGQVNSSRIRAAVKAGDMKTAAALMGRNFELDVSDIKAEEQVYDVRSANRIMPESGQYSVAVDPGGIKASAIVRDGKLKLEPWVPALSVESVESLEFI